MATIELNGSVSLQIEGLEDALQEIRSVSISTLQGRIRALAERILREQAAKDWPAGRASNGYVSTGELADAVVVTGNGTSLDIKMDGSRMSMSPPSTTGSSWSHDMRNNVLKWGVHMGVTGQAFNTEMPDLLENGGGGIRSHRGSGYFKRSFGMYQEQFIHILAEALRGAGFEVNEG